VFVLSSVTACCPLLEWVARWMMSPQCLAARQKSPLCLQHHRDNLRLKDNFLFPNMNIFLPDIDWILNGLPEWLNVLILNISCFDVPLMDIRKHTQYLNVYCMSWNVCLCLWCIINMYNVYWASSIIIVIIVFVFCLFLLTFQHYHKFVKTDCH